MAKLNLEKEELKQIQTFLNDSIDGYRDSRYTKEMDWRRWERAIKCVYDDTDHGNPGTTFKIFDPETHDALNTVVKRLLVAFFTNPKIIELKSEEYIPEDELDIAEKVYLSEISKLNLYKIFMPIFWDGGKYGTFIVKVQNEYAERNVLKTDDSDVRVNTTYQKNRPTFKQVLIEDLFFDPTKYNIEDSPVVAERSVVYEDVLLEGQKEGIYFDVDETPKGMWQYDSTEDVTEERYWDNGIDINSLKDLGKRAIYHCFFNWTIKGKSVPMYAVIEACDGHIIRIEESIYDNGMIPYETTPYEVATGSAYGTGIPELAWPLQITLNNTLNRICENEEHNNNGMFFLGQGSRNALTSMTFEKHKLIPVTTTKDIQQIQIGNMVEAYAHVRDLREQIQKKTNATKVLQGIPMSGDRTATEAIGVREEANVSIKEIISNIKKNLLEPIFTKHLRVFTQFKKGTVEIKVPINAEGTKFKAMQVNVKDVKKTLEKCTCHIVGAEDIESKLTKRGYLMQLLQLSLQVPGLLNTKELLKEVFYYDLGVKNFDKIINLTQPGQPLTIDEEKRILFSGQPLNTNLYDNHQEHLAQHTKDYEEWMSMMEDGLKAQTLTPEQMDEFSRIKANNENHLRETVARIQQQGGANV